MGKGHGRHTSQTDRATMNVAQWSTREEWAGERDGVLDEHVRLACEEFGLEPEDLAAELGEEIWTALLGFVFEDFLTRRFGPDERNPVDDYLARRGWAESAPGKRYLRAVRDSIVSLYEVTDLEPGRYLVLRDLIRGGDPLRVEERLGSEDAARWDRLAARVLDLGGRRYLAGGLLLLPFEAAESLRRVFDRAFREMRKLHRRAARRLGLSEEEPRPELVDSLLAESAPLFGRMWLTHTLEVLRQPPPRITNFDGEELVFSDVRFSLHATSRREAEARLDAEGELERIDEAEACWIWLPPGGVSRFPKAGEREDGLTFLSFAGEEGRPTLGTVELRGDQVVLSVNSKERAERGRDLLARALAGLVGPPLTSMKTPDQAQKERETSGPGPAGADLDPETNALLVREAKNRHYRACLDERIPALDGKSPRRAARSKAGREKLVAWLKYLENQDARQAKESGELSYDFGWMWEELGIAERRAED